MADDLPTKLLPVSPLTSRRSSKAKRAVPFPFPFPHHVRTQRIANNVETKIHRGCCEAGHACPVRTREDYVSPALNHVFSGRPLWRESRIATKFFRIFEFAIREKKREKRKEEVVADLSVDKYLIMDMTQSRSCNVTKLGRK